MIIGLKRALRGLPNVKWFYPGMHVQPADNFPPEWRGRTQIVPLDVQQLPDLVLVPADIINPDNPLRNDPAKLARELIRILREQ